MGPDLVQQEPSLAFHPADSLHFKKFDGKDFSNKLVLLLIMLEQASVS